MKSRCSRSTACSAKRELHSRFEVYLEQYCKSVNVEARTGDRDGARPIIFPAAIRYQGELAATCASLKAVGYAFDTDTLDKVTALVKELQDGIARSRRAMARKATAATAGARQALLRRGAAGDADGARRPPTTLEGIVADDLWPLADLPGDALHQVSKSDGSPVPDRGGRIGHGQTRRNRATRARFSARSGWARDLRMGSSHAPRHLRTRHSGRARDRGGLVGDAAARSPAARAGAIGRASPRASAATRDSRSAPQHELWLIRWPDGSSAPMHDHGGAAGVARVLEGALSERVFVAGRSAGLARAALDARHCASLRRGSSARGLERIGPRRVVAARLSRRAS